MAYPCPALQADVECSPERWRHIARRHPDLLPEHDDLLAITISDPDEVRQSQQSDSARLFTKWFPELLGGKFIVAVVVSEPQRHWLVTAYATSRLYKGVIEWQKN